MDTKTRTALGQRLWDHRQELGISQERAAVQLDTTAYSYGQWESGNDVPKKTSWIAKLALWLGASREDVALLLVQSTDDDGQPTAATLPPTVRVSAIDAAITAYGDAA